jgi:hypothetical protein
LKPDLEFRLGPRRVADNVWSLFVADGGELNVAHEDADRIVVARK